MMHFSQQSLPLLSPIAFYERFMYPAYLYAAMCQTIISMCDINSQTIFNKSSFFSFCFCVLNFFCSLILLCSQWMYVSVHKKREKVQCNNHKSKDFSA